MSKIIKRAFVPLSNIQTVREIGVEGSSPFARSSFLPASRIP
jgi:hypothetical protein